MNASAVLPNSKHLLDLSLKEKQRFLDSFDFVLTDCDGVVWNIYGPIEGTGQAISHLKNYGKHVVYVSNNSVRPLANYKQQIQSLGQEVAEEDIVNPALSVVKYLKSINFSGLIYAIGTEEFVKVIRDGGYDVLTGPNEPQPETLRNIISVVHDKKPVKAVIIDYDYNCNNIKLMRAQLYLKSDSDCLLIAGATDYSVPVTSDFQVLGPGFYVDILEKIGSKKARVLGKPGHLLGTLLKEQYKINSSQRGLFIGDMIAQDVAFGKVAGFQTLLVLTGGTKLADFQALGNDDVRPDYYTGSFADLGQIVQEVVALENKANL
ncbi:uncharacterized protein LOC129722855 [Wyeomyia smithii]|uniref:uncharacterized protein LOC129722855 n=1 Tax=Wyeomyia smithii TaxID=174621 RepID=UPI002467C9F6|nr:uncharacterized protein LOC129722855 [Wyeomyia smithii]